MVWSTTQSALYNDLSRYYEDDERPLKNRENSDPFKTGSVEKNCDELPEKSGDNTPENYYDNSHENYCNNSHENCCGNSHEKCGDNTPENCRNNSSEKRRDNLPEKCGNKYPRNFGNKCGKDPEKDHENKNPTVCPNCPRIRQAPSGQISRLISDKFSDRDMLLIAGLIFLLMKQGADKKLILALAFVLLS